MMLHDEISGVVVVEIFCHHSTHLLCVEEDNATDVNLFKYSNTAV